jgi:hypothetical protein
MLPGRGGIAQTVARRRGSPSRRLSAPACRASPAQPRRPPPSPTTTPSPPSARAATGPSPTTCSPSTSRSCSTPASGTRAPEPCASWPASCACAPASSRCASPAPWLAAAPALFATPVPLRRRRAQLPPLGERRRGPARPLPRPRRHDRLRRRRRRRRPRLRARRAGPARRIIPGAALTRVARDHVLYRSFYIIDEPLGRTRAYDHALGVQEEGRLKVLLIRNDLGGALARGPDGLYTHPCTPGGPAAARVGDPLRRQHPPLRHLHRLQGRPRPRRDPAPHPPLALTCHAEADRSRLPPAALIPGPAAHPVPSRQRRHPQPCPAGHPRLTCPMDSPRSR